MTKSETVNSHVNSCVVNVLSVTGLPQKKGVIPLYCQNYTEIKCVKDVSCVGHLSSVNLVTNVPTVVLDLPVGARLHQFWGKWAALGPSPNEVTVLREGCRIPLPVQTKLDQVTNCHKQLCQSPQKPPFYCVNTSYPMDNCLSGRHRPARQMSEKKKKRRPVFPPASRSVVLVHSPDGVSYFLPV